MKTPGVATGFCVGWGAKDCDGREAREHFLAPHPKFAYRSGPRGSGRALTFDRYFLINEDNKKNLYERMVLTEGGSLTNNFLCGVRR